MLDGAFLQLCQEEIKLEKHELSHSISARHGFWSLIKLPSVCGYSAGHRWMKLSAPTCSLEGGGLCYWSWRAYPIIICIFSSISVWAKETITDNNIPKAWGWKQAILKLKLKWEINLISEGLFLGCSCCCLSPAFHKKTSYFRRILMLMNICRTDYLCQKPGKDELVPISAFISPLLF